MRDEMEQDHISVCSVCHFLFYSNFLCLCLPDKCEPSFRECVVKIPRLLSWRLNTYRNFKLLMLDGKEFHRVGAETARGASTVGLRLKTVVQRRF